jgi:RNA:NAD 2'-phosphotransferase (TPT1/KptA family)
VIYYYTTDSKKAQEILKEGLQANSKYPVYVSRSPESASSEVHRPPSVPWVGSRRKDLVVLELRGLTRKSPGRKSEKKKWIEEEDMALTKSVPASKIRLFSGEGYGEPIDLSGPVIKKLWVDVGNKPKER